MKIKSTVYLLLLKYINLFPLKSACCILCFFVCGKLICKEDEQTGRNKTSDNK